VALGLAALSPFLLMVGAALPKVGGVPMPTVTVYASSLM
jgi:hypothetical protein